jgi:hypothetical protein
MDRQTDANVLLGIGTHDLHVMRVSTTGVKSLIVVRSLAAVCPGCAHCGLHLPDLPLVGQTSGDRTLGAPRYWLHSQTAKEKTPVKGPRKLVASSWPSSRPPDSYSAGTGCSIASTATGSTVATMGGAAFFGAARLLALATIRFVAFPATFDTLCPLERAVAPFFFLAFDRFLRLAMVAPLVGAPQTH